MQHASGTFDVKITPAEQSGADGIALGRLAVDKVFAGPLAATSHGEMLTASGTVSASAAYVLIEQVRGTLGGKAGSFALAHIGIMNRGAPDLRVVIVPDSGTGALVGITGTLAIRIEGGKHFYDLDYAIKPLP
ncbi:MAG: DUF3224 domain-containing protein [Sandarakinorhabdus sp.]|nr:DUF3224 domain-containing protein [Sandarakinorhabdus sp.]